MAKMDKAWFILPMLAYVKYEDGTHEITIGWLKWTLWMKW